MITGWTGEPLDELGASVAVRSLAEVFAESTPDERRALRREQAEADVRRARSQDTADGVAAQQFMASMRGDAPRTVGDVLAGAAGARDALDADAHSRRREAVRILRQHGLADVLGAPSGVVFDSNVGVLEPVQDGRAMAAMTYAYESGRAERAAEARRSYIEGLKVSRRAAGLDTRRESLRESRQSAAEAEYRAVLPEFADGHLR